MLKSNLEPIEESDMNLEGKLRQGNVEIAPNSELAKSVAVEREVPQESLAAEKDDAYGKILSQVQSQGDDQIDQNAVEVDAQIGSQQIDAQSQVQHLVEIASQKGIVHAVKVAQHMQDNYVLDAFHDKLLSEEFHDALVAKGMIKEI